MRLHLLVAALAAASFVVPAQAAPVTFGFDTAPLGAQTPFSLSNGGLTATFAGPDGIDPDAFEVSYNSSSGPFPVPYLTLGTAFLTVGSAFGAAGSALTISFSEALASVQFAFALDDPAGLAELILATNTGGAASATGSLTAGFQSPEGTLTFSGAPFTQLTLSSTALDFQLGDVTATAVPEPSGLAALGAGLLALTLVRRRARD